MVTLSFHSQELDVPAVHPKDAVEMSHELNFGELFHLYQEMSLYQFKARYVSPDVAKRINEEMERVITGVKGVSKDVKAKNGSKGGKKKGGSKNWR